MAAGVHRPTPEFPEHLRALYDRFPVERSLAEDPLARVRPLARDQRTAEIAGLVAATLAIGRTRSIQRAFDELVDRVDGDLQGWVRSAAAGTRDRRLEGFQHRWIRGDQMQHLAGRIGAAFADAGSIEALYLRGRAEGGGFAGGLDAIARHLRAPGADGRRPRGYAALFPSPLDAGHSACKRLALYVRWMVRTRYPDLGVWRSVSPEELRIPLDQHVFWIAYHLGLTARRTRGWPAVEEVTAALRTVDPLDPIRFDFVLCHTGVSGDCPKERDRVVCGPCAVRPDCRLWHPPRRAS